LKQVFYAALLVSSAAVAAGLEVTPARTAAAGYALTHGLVVANLVRNCRRFQDRIGEDLDAALAQWRQRNAERAAAAESYLVYARTAIERQHGELAAHDFDAKTRSVFRHKANIALNDIFERMTPQFGICARWVSAIVEGRADLDWESKYVNTLDELVVWERGLRPGAR
jgi:hypothetical protein